MKIARKLGLITQYRGMDTVVPLTNEDRLQAFREKFKNATLDLSEESLRRLEIIGIQLKQRWNKYESVSRHCSHVDLSTPHDHNRALSSQHAQEETPNPEILRALPGGNLRRYYENDSDS